MSNPARGLRPSSSAAPTFSRAHLAVPAEEAAALLARSGALTEGHFLLSSGKHSSHYFQCATLMAQAETAAVLARATAAAVFGAGLQPDVVVAPALGAVLFGYELSRALGVPNYFAERPTGEFELRRGFVLRPGQRVLLAENVVTTGGSVLEVADLVRGLGAEVCGYAAVVDRSSGRFAPPEPFVVYASLDFPVYEAEACPLCVGGVELVKPGSRAVAG